jgi:hypothetical protein
VSSDLDVAAPGIGLPEGDEAEAPSGLWRRTYDNLRTGNLGILPIVIGLAVIVVFFSFKATNFFTADNFNNIIVQMAGLTMLAFGVVFVLLLGEIDLSIGYLSGIAALAVAEFQLPGSGHACARSSVASRARSWPRSASPRSSSRLQASSSGRESSCRCSRSKA